MLLTQLENVDHLIWWMDEVYKEQKEPIRYKLEAGGLTLHGSLPYEKIEIRKKGDPFPCDLDRIILRSADSAVIFDFDKALHSTISAYYFELVSKDGLVLWLFI